MAVPANAAVNELRILSSKVDKNGIKHTRYRQYHRGVPVMGKQATIHTKPDGSVRSLGGELVHGIQQDIPSTATKQNTRTALAQAKTNHEKAQPSSAGLNYDEAARFFDILLERSTRRKLN